MTIDKLYPSIYSAKNSQICGMPRQATQTPDMTQKAKAHYATVEHLLLLQGGEVAYQTGYTLNEADIES